MSHVRIASIALVGLALSTRGATEPESTAKTPSTTQSALQDLLTRNDGLQRENAQLRAQIQALQVRLAEYRSGTQGVVPHPLPPGWKQTTYGGVPLYLVPCDTTSASVATPSGSLNNPFCVIIVARSRKFPLDKVMMGNEGRVRTGIAGTGMRALTIIMSDTIDQFFAGASLQQCSGSRQWIELGQVGLGLLSFRFFGPGVTGMSLSQTTGFSHATA